ncbi:MAG TPA: redoxin family protein [Prolixibacteraceae bacterium]|nr:redoxin family protein [Prolixibacteraceae bacterium]
MKQILIFLLVLSPWLSFGQFPVLEIGDTLPDNEDMKCVVSNKDVYVDDLNEDNGLLIIFSCNTCPFVKAWEDRYPIVNSIAEDNDIGFALINSNYLKRIGDDSPQAMKKHAQVQEYQWPYLIDKESKLANSFGAQTTPHIFLFDGDLKLVYKGAIDDNYKNASNVENFYLKNALESLGKGEEIATKETRNLGCSIKRKTD